MVKYSFVLPAYKAHFFKEAIDSILSQTYKDFELIIVNDASPEDLDSIVKQYDDSRIRYYVNKENLGGKDLVAQWNHCLEYAKGDYVILASDDDVYSSLYLEKMDELVCKYPDVNVFRPRVQIIDSNGVVTHTFSDAKELMNEVEYMYHWMMGAIGSGVPYFIFKKIVLLQYGGFKNFPSAWGSDDATVIDLAKNCIAFHSDVLFSFRMSGNNISSLKNNKQQLRLKLKAYIHFEKWLKYKGMELNDIYNTDKSNYIRKHHVEFMRGLVQNVLTMSSMSAIISNLRYICRLESVSVVRILYHVSRLLFKRTYVHIKNNNFVSNEYLIC